MWVWLKSDVGVTGTTSVTAWADQSGNGRNLTATSGQEPSLVTNVINGKPAISSYGLSAKLSTSVNFPDLSSGGTIILVARQSKTLAVNNDSFGTFIGAGSERNLLITRGANSSVSGTSIEAGIDTTSMVNSSELIPEDTFMTISIRYDGTTVKISINGGAEESVVADGIGYVATPLTIFKALGGAQGNKQMAEAIVYTRHVSDTEKTQLETYLQTEYNHY